MSLRPVEYWIIDEHDKVLSKGQVFIAMDTAARKFAIERGPVFLATVNRAYTTEASVKVINLEDAK